MARRFKPQIATGNDLLDGDVVYFTQGLKWSRFIGDAWIANNEEAAGVLLEEASKFPNDIVGVYLTDVAIDDEGRARPDHFREDFRMRGPSNRPEHGRPVERA